MVECYIVDFFPSEILKIMKKFCSDCKMIFDFEIDAYQCCFKNLLTVIQMSIIVKDSSIENENIFFPLYVFTHDDNPEVK